GRREQDARPEGSPGLVWGPAAAGADGAPGGPGAEAARGCGAIAEESVPRHLESVVSRLGGHRLRRTVQGGGARAPWAARLRATSIAQRTERGQHVLQTSDCRASGAPGSRSTGHLST